MTEDDTFNALKKTPFGQLFRLVQTTPTTEQAIEVIVAAGWEVPEFIRCHNNHILKMSYLNT